MSKDELQKDMEFLDDLTNRASWLFYGDIEYSFSDFLRKVFKKDLIEWGFADLEGDFNTAYWLFVSEMNRLDLVDYGTSPRGAWLTEDGERFKRLFKKYGEKIFDFRWVQEQLNNQK